MAGLLTRLIYIGPHPKRMTKEHRAAAMYAFEAVGKYWHEHFRPKHFTRDAYREYGYSPRAGEPGRERKKFWSSYTGRKLRQKHHKNPLVWSGESQRRTEPLNLRVRARSVRVIMHAPALNFRSQSSDINMRQELTTISERERITLEGVFAEAFAEYLNNLPPAPEVAMPQAA